MIAAAITGHRVYDPIMGEVYFRYLDGDVFVSIGSILSNIGERAFPYLRESRDEATFGFEGKGILYFPSEVVFRAMDTFLEDYKNKDEEFDITNFGVATIFADWVRLHKSIAEFLHMQKKYVGEDIELETKKFSINDVVSILNSLKVKLKKPISRIS